MAKKQDAEKEADTMNKLQVRVDRACNYIHDGRSSYAKAAVRAAKLGIDRKTVEAGAKAMRDAVDDLDAAIEQAYENPDQTKLKRSRVQLGSD